MHDDRPHRCIICNVHAPMVRAGFHQLYKQSGSDPLQIPWWECPNCDSWFASPRPTIEQVGKSIEATYYNDPAEEQLSAKYKEKSQHKLLDSLEKHVPHKGKVLDYGSNFGNFLDIAKERGWDAIGAEAFEVGVEAARKRGHTVHQGWELETLGIANESLDAIASNDVFYYVWEPYQHLVKAFDLLKPGGAIVMRTSNKRSVEGLIRTYVPAGPKRDQMISNLLIGQFHSISVHALTKIMTQIGFRIKEVRAGEVVAPPSQYSSAAKMMYGYSNFLNWITGGGSNVSPGVGIVAVKPGH